MNNSLHVVQSDLTSIHDEIKNSRRDIDFFNRVAYYGKYLIENEILHPLLNELYLESKKGLISYENKVKLFYEKWKELTSDLISIAESNGFTDNPSDPFSTTIAALKKSLSEGLPSSRDDYISYYYRKYQELIERILEGGKKNLLEDKHIDSMNKNILWEQFQDAQNEWDKFKQHREQEVWWAHYQIERLTYGAYSELESSDKYFEKNRIIDGMYRYEFNQIATGNTSTLILIHREKFEVWITRLHSYLIPRLQDYHINSGIKEPNIEQKYESQEETLGTIKIGDLSVNFEKCNLRFKQNEPVDISTANKVVKFLEYLVSQDGKVAKYLEIARATKPNGFIEKDTSPTLFKQSVQTTKKELVKVLRSAGMSQEEINRYIRSVSNEGYKLGYPVVKNSTESL